MEENDKASIEPSPQTESAVDGDCDPEAENTTTEEPIEPLKQETNENQKPPQGSVGLFVVVNASLPILFSHL